MWVLVFRLAWLCPRLGFGIVGMFRLIVRFSIRSWRKPSGMAATRWRHSYCVDQIMLSCRSWLQLVQRQVKLVGWAWSCISDHNSLMAVSCSRHLSHASNCVMDSWVWTGEILLMLTQVIDSRSVWFSTARSQIGHTNLVWLDARWMFCSVSMLDRQGYWDRLSAHMQI